MQKLVAASNHCLHGAPAVPLSLFFQTGFAQEMVDVAGIESVTASWIQRGKKPQRISLLEQKSASPDTAAVSPLSARSGIEWTESARVFARVGESRTADS